MENKVEIISYIIAGMLLMICLALGILAVFIIHRKNMIEKEAKIVSIEHEKNIEVFKASNEAEEREKKKISKELHDGIVPSLSAVERSLEKHLKDHENGEFDPIRLRRDISEIEGTIESVRTIAHELIPPTLVSFGLIKALSYQVQRVNDAGLQADFENSSPFDEKLRFSMQEQVNIFRMCTEILNNLHKHAQYKYLRVAIEKIEGYFVIDFTHDGKGITNKEIEAAAKNGKGLGLQSLMSRALIINAIINYSMEEDTANVSIKIPINE